MKNILFIFLILWGGQISNGLYLGLGVGGSYFLTPHNNKLSLSLGGEIRFRLTPKEKKDVNHLEYGINLGFYNHFIVNHSTSFIDLFIVMPLEATIAYKIRLSKFIIKPGLGVGGIVSWIKSDQLSGFGLDLIAEPFLALGIAFSRSELLLVPSYQAIFENIRGGELIHEIATKLVYQILL